jgi:pyruvate/2-oxoglutarate dehydrogenase complex dihydrolipoamide dehydrogenase (E3) component
MKHENFDVIVLGTGQAGPIVATRFAAAGMKTAIIEREHLGGTCVNDGCTPTKTLVASARAAYIARRAADFGVRLGSAVSVDMKAVKARKDAVVDQSVSGLQKWLTSTPNLELIWGEARFVAAHTLQVGERLLDAAKIFINVGGRPTTPDWPGLEDVPYLTNVSMMALDELPEHLVIVGGSYIGLEFAQVLRRFGSKVTVLEYADRLIAREDEDVTREVQAILEREGIVFELGVRDGEVSRAEDGDGVHVSVKVGGVPREIEGSHLLVAVGRRPNTDGLGLDKAGIALDQRGNIVVDDELRTNVEGIWALGDVNGRGAFTHTSYNDGEIVVANLLGGEHRRVSERIPAYAMYIDPPLARVGLSETEARKSGRATLMATMPMSRVARARERGETEGFMKVLVDAQTQRILGATLLGIEADEVVHLLLDVMAADAPYTVIQRCMHIHPTVSELIPTLLGDLKPLG